VNVLRMQQEINNLKSKNWFAPYNWKNNNQLHGFSRK